MPIDVHCHLMTGREDFPELQFGAQAKLTADGLTKMGKPTSVKEVERNILPTIFDSDGKIIISKMDEAGIEKTVILCIDFGLKMDLPDKAIEERNRRLAEIARRNPERLIVFCGVAPQRENALGLFRKAVEEWGMKGLKLEPLSNEFRASDRLVYPFYEIASELNLPIMFHSGPRGSEFEESEWTHPKHLDKVLADFPRLNIIAAHMSFAWWRELVEIAKTRQNLFCDFSAYQLAASLNYGQFCHVLRRVLDGFGMHRVMFGTDGPFFDIFLSKKDWVKLIKNLPAESPEGIKFTEEEIRAILDENARAVLQGKR